MKYLIAIFLATFLSGCATQYVYSIGYRSKDIRKDDNNTCEIIEYQRGHKSDFQPSSKRLGTSPYECSDELKRLLDECDVRKSISLIEDEKPYLYGFEHRSMGKGQCAAVRYYESPLWYPAQALQVIAVPIDILASPLYGAGYIFLMGLGGGK